MKEFIKTYILEKWWFPTLLFFLSVFLFFYLPSSFMWIPTFYVMGLGLAFVALAGVIQLFYKRWLAALMNLGVALISILVMSTFMFAFYMLFGPDEDGFADHLSIPEGISIEKPIDTKTDIHFKLQRPDAILHLTKSKPDFQLYNSFQPGLFEYDVWMDTKQNGIVFLKVYKITQGTPLSASELKKSTIIKVKNTGGSLQRFQTQDLFTIYEGDWGKPYAARFEVWFQPDGATNAQKILQKNYIIEGWQR